MLTLKFIPIFLMHKNILNNFSYIRDEKALWNSTAHSTRAKCTLKKKINRINCNRGITKIGKVSKNEFDFAFLFFCYSFINI